MQPLHPLYERLLTVFCESTALDVRLVREMIDGQRPVLPVVQELMHRHLGLPPSVWEKRGSHVRATLEERLVSPALSRHDGAVAKDTATDVAERPKMRRRRYPSAVTHSLDLLGWRIKDLTDAVNKTLPRSKRVSRASMQFYATGTRKVGAKGKSEAHPVQAPAYIREAAFKVTSHEAAKRGKPDAILRPDEWPNVEPS